MQQPLDNGDETPPLRERTTPQALRNLVALARSGDKNASLEPLACCRRVIETTTKIFSGRFSAQYDRESLEQEANIAVIEAIQTIQVQDLDHLERYVSRAIRNAFNDLVRANSSNTRMQWNNAAEFEKKRQGLLKELGRNPTRDEVYDALDWSDTKRKNHKDASDASSKARTTKNFSAFELQGDAREDFAASIDGREAEDCNTPEDLVQLQIELKKLPIDEQSVIQQRYLIQDPPSQKNCAQQMGLTEYNVAQLEKSALRKLKNAMSE